MYALTERVINLYGRLQDELSRKIFWARLRCDVHLDIDSILDLAELSGVRTEALVRGRGWRKCLDQISAAGDALILYGSGTNGRHLAGILRGSGADFTAFCDRTADGATVMGKPVWTPGALFSRKDACRVIIASAAYRGEILDTLLENGFPRERILDCFDFLYVKSETFPQYFEFPDWYERGTAFVDGGCFDGADSLRFAAWCGGAYSKIYAFEPDAENYRTCEARFRQAGIRDVALFPGGLSASDGEASFSTGAGEGSYLLGRGEIASNAPRGQNQICTVRTFALDSLADTRVGMIKLDIEGAELDALHGAARTIQRDRPLLAVCVYHRKGDVLAVMDCLNRLVPEYRFRLRHYSEKHTETVLYAAV